MDQLVVMLAIVAAVEPSVLEQRALQQAIENRYQLDQLATEVLRRHTTEGQRKFVGNAALITRIVVERKVTYEWRF